MQPPEDTLQLKHLPEVKFSHVRNMTDDTGIIQHAIFNIPNRKEGYCIDDNARALLLCVLAAKDKSNEIDTSLLQVYLSFIHYMQTPNGELKNFMSYTKVAEEERGSEDSFGRTIMALGFLANEGSSKLLSRTGAEIFTKIYSHIEKLQSIRGIANAIVGVCQFIKYNYPDDIKRDLVIDLANKMVKMYEENKRAKWHWFEPVLTYDNAILPLALLNAYEITSDEAYLNIAYEAIQIAIQSNKKLILCGLIQDRAYFDEKVAPYLNDSGTVYMGNAVPKQRNQLLGDALALLHPISFEEPFGLSVAEAMMCGTPVIAFERGAMKELIVEGKTGFLVHTIEEAVAAVDKITCICRCECRKHAMRKFSSKVMTAGYIKLYEQIARKSNSL